MALPNLSTLNWRDPRVAMRAVLGALLVANLIAFYFVMYPLGGSPEELEQQIAQQRRQSAAQRVSIERLSALKRKVEGARTGEARFEEQYFTSRQVVYSTIVAELTQAAEGAGIRVKDHALLNEDIEGSDTLSMITINANYEGTYGDLLSYVNRLDRSGRFIIIDSLGATPQQNSNVLNVAMKMNVFVRNTDPAPQLQAATKGGPAQ
jgi:type IV pilus assembly protein PilO